MDSYVPQVLDIQVNSFFYPSQLLFKFYFCSLYCRITGGYLCLAEVKWVKTGVPGILCSLQALLENFYAVEE